MEENISQKLNKISPVEENTDELFSIFNSVDGYALPFVIFNIQAGSFVVRQRINLKGKDFNYISELSYPPNYCCNTYGRANIPFHSMFYCCSFSMNNNSPLPRYIALQETSSFLKDTNSIGIERSTCSRWDVVQQLDVLALPFSANYDRTIADIEQIKIEWNSIFNDVNIDKSALELVNYMSDEIAKDSRSAIDYFKIANFIYFLLYLNENTMSFDGLIYPSVAAGGEGFNMVLKPETVDGKLKFNAASLCYLIKNGIKAELYPINQSVGCNLDGSLIYVPHKDFDNSKCDGLSFIN